MRTIVRLLNGEGGNEVLEIHVLESSQALLCLYLSMMSSLVLCLVRLDRYRSWRPQLNVLRFCGAACLKSIGD